MDTRKTWWAAAAACAGALLLAGCGGGGGGGDAGGGDGGGGGGGGGPTTPPLVSGTQVPVSATLSAGGAFDFVAGLAAPDDSGEPLVLGDATLATSETDEPRAVQ